jgi:transposase
VDKGSGLTRGDRNRNARKQRLREVVGADRVVLAVDLGEDKQVAAVMTADQRVLGRKTARCKAGGLGPVLEWAAGLAARRGFAGVTVACEPTGNRWMTVMGEADARGMGFVCVQPLAVARAREGDDYTLGKTDNRDTLLIGVLTWRLECYLPERAGEEWARLRHLGARRWRLMAESGACVQQVRDLLGVAWPAVLEAAAQPLESATWLACLAVTLERCNGQPGRLRKGGKARFEAAVRRELHRWGASRLCKRIFEAAWGALGSAGGVAAQRRGALERARLVLGDWRYARAALAEAEARMVAVLDVLGVAGLAASIDGLSPVCAAAILAETGDPARFTSARAVVKHAGLNPAEKTSATMRGVTRVSRRGRPGLRNAAWKAAWGAVRGNRVLAAKYAWLTTRDDNRLRPGQARVACAAALLRWIHAIITGRVAWDAAIAAGDLPPAARAAVMAA